MFSITLLRENPYIALGPCNFVTRWRRIDIHLVFTKQGTDIEPSLKKEAARCKAPEHMDLFPSLSLENIHHYHRTITRSVAVRHHRDVLDWLQGDIQTYLPHQIMIAAWGDFETGAIQHDIISLLPGVRSQNSSPVATTPLLLQLFARWRELGRKAYAINESDTGFLIENTAIKCHIAEALQNMHCALVHGISDERGSHDCLYVAFNNQRSFSAQERGAMATLVPHIDSALRQVKHLPHQEHLSPPTSSVDNTEAASPDREYNLSEREVQVLYWVTLGKTNPEIGRILEISEFTVKNHMQRIFKKLDVFNRAQAVGKYNALLASV